jgi:hypothetical protein
MARFFDVLRTRKGEPACRVAERLFQWSDNLLPVVWWGVGIQDGSCFRGIRHKDKNVYLFAVWTYGKIELQFQWLAKASPFDSEAARTELLRRLNLVPGIEFPSDAVTRRPSFELSVLEKMDAEIAFRDAIQWAVGLIRSEDGRERQL